MTRYIKFVPMRAVVVVAAFPVGQLAYEGGTFIGSH